MEILGTTLAFILTFIVLGFGPIMGLILVGILIGTGVDHLMKYTFRQRGDE